MHQIILLFLVFFFFIEADAKIRILTFHYNLPELIDLQYKSYKKFMTEDYEIIVFNDAEQPDIEVQIQKECERVGFRCIRYNQCLHQLDPLNFMIKKWLDNPRCSSHLRFASHEIKDIAKQPSVRHCHVIQFALDHYGYDHDDIVVIADGDIFPIRDLNIRALLKNVPLIGIRKCISSEHVEYLWVPFIAMDMKKIPLKHELKFHVDLIHNKIYDSGAHSYYFLQKAGFKAEKYQGFSSTGYYHLSKEALYRHGFHDKEITLIKNLPWPLRIEFHVQHKLLHLGGSSFSYSGINTKFEYVKKYVNQITQ